MLTKSNLRILEAGLTSVGRMKVYLETDKGEKAELVLDVHGVLWGLLMPPPDDSYPLLAFVDPYGRTLFNRLQMNAFLAEWTRLTGTASAGTEIKTLNLIKGLAERCKDTAKHFLVFVGD